MIRWSTRVSTSCARPVESEIDFPDELASEVGICRTCGMAFLVETPAQRSGTRSA